jgi:hypothetical protein
VITLEGVVDPVPMAEIRIEPRKTKLGTIQMNIEKRVSLNVTNTGTAPLTIGTFFPSGAKPSIMMRLKRARLGLLPEKAEK